MTYRQFLHATLSQASEIALSHFGKVFGTVKAGDPNQVLTDADIAVGGYIVEAIGKVYPDHNVIDEEAGVIDRGSHLTWVVDPICGTSNFAVGVPTYCIALGLLRDSQPIAGGIIAPALSHFCISEIGQGTVCNDKPVRVTEDTNLISSLVACGIDGNRSATHITYNECRILAEIILNSRNLRTSGSQWDGVLVALGKYGACINFCSKIWDCVALHSVITEAGGKFTDGYGQPMNYENPLSRTEENFSLCAASPLLHSQVQELIHRVLEENNLSKSA